MANYFLRVAELDADAPVVYVFGDIEEIGYFGKRVPKKLEDDKTYEVHFAEVIAIGGVRVDSGDPFSDSESDNIKRVILSLTGDAETIAFVLKRKVASERKASEIPAAAPAS